MKEAVIVEAVRTPMGRHSGILKDMRTDDLGAYIIAKLVERTGVNKEEIEDVYFGCTNQAGEDSRNVARNASLLAGLPYTIPGATVNRLCGSGLEAINQAGRAAETDHGDLFVAGGVESMTRGPWVMGKPTSSFQRRDRRECCREIPNQPRGPRRICVIQSQEGFKSARSRAASRRDHCRRDSTEKRRADGA